MQGIYGNLLGIMFTAKRQAVSNNDTSTFAYSEITS